MAQTCAAIGSVMLAWRLLLATGEERFADLIERTAFNAILSGLGSDGCHFFYSNPLQRRSDGIEVLEGAASTRRAPWFEVSCCPPNLMRFLATLPDLLATTDAEGVQVHQFATGSITVPLAGGRVALRTSTAYPWDGDVDIEIDREPGPTLAALAQDPRLVPRCDRDAGRTSARDPPAARASSRWSAPGRPETASRSVCPWSRASPSPIRASTPLRHSVALERGPLVYALEDADLPDGSSVEGLEVDAMLDVRAIPGIVPGVDEGIRLAFGARLREDPAETDWPYRSLPGPDVAASGSMPAASVKVEAIPYFAWARTSGPGHARLVARGPRRREPRGPVACRLRSPAVAPEHTGVGLGIDAPEPPGRAAARGSGTVVTMRDIAQASGVSLSTVSRVLNESPSRVPIALETRERILAMALRLGYRPNPFARVLRGAPTMVLGAVVRDFSDPFFAGALEALAVEAMAEGYNVLLGRVQAGQDGRVALPAVLEPRRCDAVLMLGVMDDQPQLVDRFWSRRSSRS